MSLFEKKTQNVLVDRDILALVGKGKLFTNGFDPHQLGACAYDLRAGASLTSRQRGQTFNLTEGEFVLEPGEVATIQTIEHVDLRDPISAGFIFSSHTQLSQGMFHPMTSIDPGFNGPLAITVLNLGTTGFRVKHGERIAKLILLPVSPIPNRLYGEGQKPRVREGSLEHSLVVDRAESDDDFTDGDDFFSGPMKKLAARVSGLEDGVELFRAQQANRRYKSAALLIWAVLAGAMGSIIANNFNKIVDWFWALFH